MSKNLIIIVLALISVVLITAVTLLARAYSNEISSRNITIVNSKDYVYADNFGTKLLIHESGIVLNAMLSDIDIENASVMIYLFSEDFSDESLRNKHYAIVHLTMITDVEYSETMEQIVVEIVRAAIPEILTENISIRVN